MPAQKRIRVFQFGHRPLLCNSRLFDFADAFGKGWLLQSDDSAGPIIKRLCGLASTKALLSIFDSNILDDKTDATPTKDCSRNALHSRPHPNRGTSMTSNLCAIILESFAFCSILWKRFVCCFFVCVMSIAVPSVVWLSSSSSDN